MSVAAIVALAHDMVITVGVYALSGFEVTPATVTGLLTILGFSLYDTVVVFDKIRENTKNLRASQTTYARAANLAVNQTLVRSINTSLVALIPVGAILYVSARPAGRELAEGPLARAVRRHGGRGLLLDLHRHPAAGAPEVRTRPRSCWPSAGPRPASGATPTATRRCRSSRTTCRSCDPDAEPTPGAVLVDDDFDEDDYDETLPRAGRGGDGPRPGGADTPRPVGPSRASGRAQPTRQPRSKRGK